MVENIRGTNVALVSWTTAVIMFFAVAIKLGTNIMVKKAFSFTIDGALILVAMACALGQTGAITLTVDNGLGKHIAEISTSQLIAYQQSLYAADILFLATLCFTKLSVIAFFLHSTMGSSPRVVGGILGVAVSMWFLISLFGLAFRCSLPNSWMFINNTCINRKAFWYFIGAGDVISDLCILALPFYTLQFLQLTSAMRSKIITPFFARVIVLPLSILRMYYLSKELDTADSPYDMTTSALFEIIEMNIAIIVSCIPFSRLLITSVSSGLMTTNIRNHAPNFDGHGDPNGSGGQRFSDTVFDIDRIRTPNTTRRDKSKGLGSMSNFDFSDMERLDRESKQWELPWAKARTTTRIENYVAESGEASGSSSPSGSEQNIIREIIEWDVTRDSLPASR